MNHSLNKDKTVAVATDYHWQPMESCPLHCKVQLLGAGGVATYGVYTGKESFFVAWAPLPRKKK